jgi:hypothetical protein
MLSRRRPAHELRIAIDCLPLGTRKAMLEGMELNTIIVGAYVDRSGGVCPMLAAHRNGGRTSLASFARAWDRYTRPRRPRPATERELRTLRTMLEASIALDEPGFTELSEAIAEHQAATAEPKPQPRERKETQERRETGERHRAADLRDTEGWSWTLPFRRLDDLELVMREVRAMERERARREREPELV